MPGTLIFVDFRSYPDNHSMPPAFALGGLQFAALDPAESLLVNDTAGDRGLRFGPTGLRVELPASINGLYFTAGAFGGTVTANAIDGGGAIVRSQQILPPNQYNHVLNYGPNMIRLELIGGGNEGVLLELIAPFCC